MFFQTTYTCVIQIIMMFIHVHIDSVTTTSEASVIEARIRLLKEQLRQRKEEVKRVQSEQKRKKKALLKQQEEQLKRKLEVCAGGYSTHVVCCRDLSGTRVWFVEYTYTRKLMSM